MNEDKSPLFEAISSWKGTLTAIPVCAVGQIKYSKLGFVIEPFSDLGMVTGILKAGNQIRCIVLWEKASGHLVYVPNYAVLNLNPIFFPEKELSA
jgi:hypothetical protein